MTMEATQAKFRCVNGHEFRTPSFSEGPKVENTDTGKVERFTECWHMCPVCLTTNFSLKQSRGGHLRRVKT